MKKTLLILAAAVLLPFGFNAEAHTVGEVHIVVSIRNQSAWLLDADNNIIMESPVATGKRSGGRYPGVPTPTGHFVIGSKEVFHRSTVNRNWIMRYYMHLAGEPFGLHQYYMPYISKNGYFGSPASHGCVRMPMDKAIFFYEHVHVGTPVTIIPN